MAAAGARLLLVLALAGLARAQDPPPPPTPADCPEKRVSHGSTCAAGTAPCAYTCDAGYYPSGAEVCNSGGVFGHRSYGGGSCVQCHSVPHCAASQCTGANDATCQSGRCAAGYTADASCGPSPCDATPSEDHVTGGCAGHHTGDTCATFTCESGYKTQGRLTCGTDGHWTGGSCKAESCSPLTPPHALAPVTGDYGRSSYALQCEPGYYANGVMRCQWSRTSHSGVFSGATCDECNAIERCPLALGGLACSRSGDSTCSQCDAGYVPTSPPTACIGTPCADADTAGVHRDAFEHGRIVDSAATPLRYPSSIQFECDAGYVLSDAHTNRTCTTSGGWSSPFPTCIETCGTDPCKNDAICTDDGNLAGGKGKFNCACPNEAGKPFWEGERCATNVNECNDPGRLGRAKPWDLNGGCDHKIAQGNGRGQMVPLAQCVNSTGGFTCGACSGPRDCCEQGDQGGIHEFPCGTDSNTQCSTESRNWTEAGCTGPATAAASSFTFSPQWFVAGGQIEIYVTPLDINSRLSADNGITSAEDLQGMVLFDSTTSQALEFTFNITRKKYTSQHLETYAGAYQLNISVHNQLFSSSPRWQEIHLPTAVEFHVVPAPADATNTLFGGCWFGTSSRLDSCYCVEEAGERIGCRTLPGVRNALTIIVRDQFDNIRDPTVISKITQPARQTADVVTAEVLGSALVTYDHPHGCAHPCHVDTWAKSEANSSSYLFEFTMPSPTEFSYTLTVKINGVISTTTPIEYIFHTSLNASKCDDLRCSEFYEPSRFGNLSRWMADGSMVEQDCRAAGCLFVAEPNDQLNTLAITLADALQPHGRLNLSVIGLCLMDDANFNANTTFVSSDPSNPLDPSSKGKGFCMGDAEAAPDDPNYCNETRLDCYLKSEIIIASVRHPEGAPATEYEVDFRVPHPGFYSVGVEMQEVEDAPHSTQPVRLLVGPGLPSLDKSSFQMITDRHESKEGTQLKFEVLVVDRDGDPRFGLDEVVVELSRLPRNDPSIGSNDRLLQPTEPLTMRLMTKHSRDQAAGGGIALIPTGSRGDGRYVVSQTFPTTLDENTGSRGVYKMRVWVCPPANGTACIPSDENEIKRPDSHSTDSHSTLRFTVCPKSASISDDIHDVNSLESALAECKCDPGYSGPDGKTCTACAPGEFKKEPGQASCVQCTAGTHCACEVDQIALTTDKTSVCADPCTSCVACAAGYYQHQPGQPTCAACPKVAQGVGFVCPLDGMTWPLALPGYWVSGNDPTVFHDCAARPAACPGSDFATNTSRLTALRLSRNNPSADSLLATCFRRSDTNDDVSLSGWMILPHDGLQQRWMSGQTVAPKSLECWNVVGASCAEGYSGAQHNKPCLDCDTSWYPDSSTTTCAHCPEDSGFWLGFGVVVGSLIVAPITIRFAGMAKHAGALTAPLMSLVNFLQSIDLFRQLQLQWPAGIKEFVLRIASIFNLNINILGIHPECSLHLNFWQKWCLKMLSPVGVIVALAASIFIRRSFAQWVRKSAQVTSTAKRAKSDLAMSIRGTERGGDLYLSGGLWDEATAPELQVQDGGVSRPASPDQLALAQQDAEPEPEISDDTLDELMTTENSLVRGSSRQAMLASTAELGGGGTRRSGCIRFVLTLLGLIIGTIVGLLLTSSNLKFAGGAGLVSAGAAYYFASKESKAHECHEVSSGEEDSTTLPTAEPPFLFGDRQFAALREGSDKPQSLVFNVHSRSDNDDRNVISIGLFENFNIESAARYEIRITKQDVRILRIQSASNEILVTVPVTGDLLATHDDPWIWVEIHQGEIHIGSSPTPPALDEGQPVGAAPLISCSDGDALTVTHIAVRSWMLDGTGLVSDAEPGYVPSKNDWIVDIPGEPSSSWFRRDGWAEFNQTTFEARSIYVFLVFMMVSYVFLVSTAVQPWICFEDADGRLYLTADPTVNCKSCEFEDDIPGWLGGYDGLKVLSAIALLIYGLAIPGMFFWIVHTHKEEVKSGPYLQKYGFLTSKFSEKYYGWEIAVLFRKASLSVITAHAGKTSTRCGLLSMSVMFVAFGGQVSTHPLPTINLISGISDRLHAFSDGGTAVLPRRRQRRGDALHCHYMYRLADWSRLRFDRPGGGW